MNQLKSDLNMGKNHLECRECKKEYEPTFKYICDECFGPLDVKYDFSSVNKNTFKDREKTYWRYFELLPIIDKKNIVSIEAGMTPLVKAEELGKELGLNNLYIKNDKTCEEHATKMKLKILSLGCPIDWKKNPR